MCANCGSDIGPFYRSWKERGVVIIASLPPLCKNTKQDPNRVSACVERRAKTDADKYKEQLNAYA